LAEDSLAFEDGVSDEVVAETVDGEGQVVLVSEEQVVVDSIVEVAHFHHKGEILHQSFVLDA